MALDTHLKNALLEMDEKYGGDEMVKLLGPTMLSWTSTDSSREYMFTSHVKQVLNLLQPDVPRLQGGFENTVGEKSHAYKRMEGTWEVVDIIQKFPEIPNSIYTIILYNKQTDTYEMIEKQVAESLTEKFGYIYNTSFMDGLQVGQKFTDKVIYKSTSFDEHMNYRYGKNANVYYSTSTDTLEDAIRIRKSWADTVKSVEVDTVDVHINDNDVPLNIYGDDNDFKPFPEIGEPVKNSVLCATRRINKNHILYDFQTENMRKIYSTDTEYYVTKGAMIYDLDVYYNGDDPFPTTVFYQQIKRYYDDICAYADKVFEAATRIKQSGSHYTKNVSYLRSKYDHYNDPKYKWKLKDRAFGNMLISFKVCAVVGLEPGSKLSGRYGDKGVISQSAGREDLSDQMKDSLINSLVTPDVPKEMLDELRASMTIVDDSRMPYTDDGIQVDIQLNMSGSLRR